MTFGSLFSGIGGIDLGFERAGMTCLWQVEIDDFCQKVLTKHWPDVPKYKDIRNVGKENLKTVDLIAGGFPCQDISWTWRGKGLQGKKSNLWCEYYRVIEEIKPKFAVIENVGNLKSRGLVTILQDLAKIGYNAEWATIDTRDFGCPHPRPRVFITAYREWMPIVFAFECEPCEMCGEPICPYCKIHYADCSCFGPHSEMDGWELQEKTWGLVAYPDMPGCKKQCGASTIPAEHITSELYRWWKTEPGMGRVANGVSHRLDRLKSLGNAVVPQVAEYIGKAIINSNQCIQGTHDKTVRP